MHCNNGSAQQLQIEPKMHSGLGYRYSMRGSGSVLSIEDGLATAASSKNTSKTVKKSVITRCRNAVYRRCLQELLSLTSNRSDHHTRFRIIDVSGNRWLREPQQLVATPRCAAWWSGRCGCLKMSNDNLVSEQSGNERRGDAR